MIYCVNLFPCHSTQLVLGILCHRLYDKVSFTRTVSSRFILHVTQPPTSLPHVPYFSVHESLSCALLSRHYPQHLLVFANQKSTPPTVDLPFLYHKFRCVLIKSPFLKTCEWELTFVVVIYSLSLLSYFHCCGHHCDIRLFNEVKRNHHSFIRILISWVHWGHGNVFLLKIPENMQGTKHPVFFLLSSLAYKLANIFVTFVDPCM